MSMKHTPGPWTVGTRITDDNTLPIESGGKASPLAYVAPRPFYDDTQAANARLIAAAPDLLNHLEGLQEMLAELGEELNGYNDDLSERCTDKADYLRHVIARVQGED